ncbi:hypothetical protein [Rhodococcus koreensis]
MVTAVTERVGRAVHAALALCLVALVAASVAAAFAAPAAAQDPARIPAAPEGYSLVDEPTRQANNLPEGAILLGAAGQAKPTPAGYTTVERQGQGSCTTIPLGGGATTQVCATTTYAVPESGPAEAQPTTPELPPVGTGAPGEGTFGFDEYCESMTKDTGSWLQPSQIVRKLIANPGEQVCKVANVVSHPGDALQKMWDSQFGKNVKSLVAGVADGWGTMLNWWFTTPSPVLSDAQYLDVLQSYMLPIQGFVLVLSIIVACIRIAVAQNGTEAVPAMDLVRTFVRTIMSMTVFGVALGLGIQISDGIAIWLLTESGGTDLGAKVEGMLIDDNSTWGPGWVLFIALFGMFGAFMQTVLLVVRQAFLMVIVGLLPVAAAASGTEMGSQSYEKMRNWAIAFVLFKPAAAAVMAVAFWAADPQSDVTKLQGLILLTVAAVALPALLRVLNVSTSNSGSPTAVLGPAAGAGAMAGMLASGGTSAALMAATRGTRAISGGAMRSHGGATGNSSGGSGGGGGARQRSMSGSPSSYGGGQRRPGGGSRPGSSVRSLSSGAATARAGAARSGQALDTIANDIAGDIPGRPFTGGNEVHK